MTGAGHNLARYLVEDRIEGKPGTLTVTKNRHLWRVVPKGVAFRYIPEQYHDEMRALMKAGAAVNPLYYKADRNLVHKLRILKDQWRYYQRYASSTPKPC